MPEMRFVVRWPDESKTTCYSPSLVVRDYLDVGATYPLPEFVRRTRDALEIASQRVFEKFGFPCSLAVAEMQRIDRMAAKFEDVTEAVVRVEAFETEGER